MPQYKAPSKQTSRLLEKERIGQIGRAFEILFPVAPVSEKQTINLAPIKRAVFATEFAIASLLFFSEVS